MDIYSILDHCLGFQWDEGNSLKNWLKHRVTEGEAEQVFFNEPLLLWEDKKHSQQESRFWALGHSDQGRILFIVFIVRKDFVRVISVRDMNKKERDIYEKFKTDTKV